MNIRSVTPWLHGIVYAVIYAVLVAGIYYLLRYIPNTPHGCDMLRRLATVSSAVALLLLLVLLIRIIGWINSQVQTPTNTRR